MDQQTIGQVSRRLFNSMSLGLNVTVVTADGSELEGFVQRVTGDPYVFTLCKHQVPRGDSGLVLVDLRRVLRIALHHKDGTDEVFGD
jgi:hypothetical protein